MTTMFPREAVTGLVLAGGRGSRMGGVDKGLQMLRGAPMVMHALQRLAPQVGGLLINANRNLAAYEAFGVPVIPDSTADFAGPLAGMLTGLEESDTPWLATVPCDCPFFPEDLVPRLWEAAMREGADVAIATAPEEDGAVRAQPVFCLMRAEVHDGLSSFLRSGGRKIDAWTATLRQVLVSFEDPTAFRNVNTLEELRELDP